MLARILVIEDELRIQEILTEFLREYGYEVDCANDGLEGMAFFNKNSCDLVLLDVMMPKMNGFAVLELIRQTSDIPVILLTAMESEVDQIKGFDLGVDDYITKPFSMNLVIRRIEAILRRRFADEKMVADEALIVCKGVSLDPVGCEICYQGQSIAFTYKEYELVKLFMMHPNRVFTRDELLNQVWGYDFFGNDTVVNNHIMRIRKKLGDDFIVTVRGMGYKIGT